MVSCVVTGLTEALETDQVKWTTFEDAPITTGSDGFTIETSSLTGNTQTTTLTVPGSQTDTDKVYKCVITPTGDDVTAKTKEVNLKVFSK